MHRLSRTHGCRCFLDRRLRIDFAGKGPGPGIGKHRDRESRENCDGDQRASAPAGCAHPQRHAQLARHALRGDDTKAMRHVDEHLLGIVGIDSPGCVAVQDRHRPVPNGADARLARSPARHARAEPIREARTRRGRLDAGTQSLLVRRHHRRRSAGSAGARLDYRPARGGSSRYCVREVRLMSDQVRHRRREQDFHSATHALDWHLAEQLARVALQEGELSAAERDAWLERRNAARRGIVRRG